MVKCRRRECGGARADTRGGGVELKREGGGPSGRRTSALGHATTQMQRRSITHVARCASTGDGRGDHRVTAGGGGGRGGGTIRRTRTRLRRSECSGRVDTATSDCTPLRVIRGGRPRTIRRVVCGVHGGAAATCCCLCGPTRARATATAGASAGAKEATSASCSCRSTTGWWRRSSAAVLAVVVSPWGPVLVSWYVCPWAKARAAPGLLQDAQGPLSLTHHAHSKRGGDEQRAGWSEGRRGSGSEGGGDATGREGDWARENERDSETDSDGPVTTRTTVPFARSCLRDSSFPSSLSSCGRTCLVLIVRVAFSSGVRRFAGVSSPLLLACCCVLSPSFSLISRRAPSSPQLRREQQRGPPSHRSQHAPPPAPSRHASCTRDRGQREQGTEWKRGWIAAGCAGIARAVGGAEESTERLERQDAKKIRVSNCRSQPCMNKIGRPPFGRVSVPSPGSLHRCCISKCGSPNRPTAPTMPT